MAEEGGRSYFDEIAPMAKEAIIGIIARTENDKLLFEVSKSVLEAAGKMQPARGANQIIITDSDVKILSLGVKEVLDAERHFSKEQA